MEALSEFDGKLQALIVPVQTMNLVIPQSMVAEILAVPAVTEIDGPAWLSGIIEWRAMEIPLISVDALCQAGRPGERKRARRAAVLQCLDNYDELQYYAIEINSIPHPVRLGETDFQQLNDDNSCEIVEQMVIVAGVRCAIPGFEDLEARAVSASAQL
ncbi:MAG: chemotaxis protein CheW [Thiotrichales bacterium]